MDEFGNDQVDDVFLNYSKKTKEQSDSGNNDLLSILPKCEQGLECDNCGNCH